MLVAEIMTAEPATVRPETSVKAALQELSDRSITALPVVDADGRLVGIIGEADLLRAGVVRDARATVRRGDSEEDDPHTLDSPATVGDIMTRQVVYATPVQDVASVVGAMLEHAVRSVPVVQGSHVVGMLSRSDVVRALSRADTEIAREITVLLKDAGLTGWHCVVADGRVRLAGRPARDGVFAARLARTVAGVRSVVAEPNVLAKPL
jgi:CBS domain-containing protein